MIGKIIAFLLYWVQIQLYPFLVFLWWLQKSSFVRSDLLFLVETRRYWELKYELKEFIKQRADINRYFVCSGTSFELNKSYYWFLHTPLQHLLYRYDAERGDDLKILDLLLNYGADPTLKIGAIEEYDREDGFDDDIFPKYKNSHRVFHKDDLKFPEFAPRLSHFALDSFELATKKRVFNDLVQVLLNCGVLVFQINGQFLK